MKRGSLIIIVLTILLIVVLVQGAAADYPEKDIIMIVPWGPGGGADIVARVFTRHASEIIDKEFIFDYRAGAAGAIGTAFLAKEKPDGYTIAIQMYPNLGMMVALGMGGFSLDDFTHLGQISRSAMAIGVAKDSPFETLQDLIEYAREHPKELTMAISGLSGTGGLTVLGLTNAAEIEFSHVMYSGGGETIPALAGGHVDVAVGAPSMFLSLGDRVRMLAVGCAKRLISVPDVPTFKEQGVDFAIETGRTLIAPAGMDSEIRQNLEDLMKTVFDTPEFQEDLIRAGDEPFYRTGKELKDHVKALQAQLEEFAPLIAK